MMALRAIAVLVLAGIFVTTNGAEAAEKRNDPPPGLENQQKPGPGRGKHGGGGRLGLRGAISKEIMEHLYPIGLVRRHAADIKLTEAQITKLRNVVTKVHSEVEGLKWDVERESQKLGDLVKAGASLKKISKQMDIVFNYENMIKKKHLSLLITVRDILTAEQKKILDEVKNNRPRKVGNNRPQPPHRYRGASGLALACQ